MYDESDAEGAQYPYRKLQDAPTGVKLSDMTVSYGGSDDGILAVTYICASGCGYRCRPSPATHAILAQLKAGFSLVLCLGHIDGTMET